jgi:hypothetical protein
MGLGGITLLTTYEGDCCGVGRGRSSGRKGSVGRMFALWRRASLYNRQLTNWINNGDHNGENERIIKAGLDFKYLSAVILHLLSQVRRYSCDELN